MSRTADHDDVFTSRFNRILAVLFWVLDAVFVVGTIAVDAISDSATAGLGSIVPGAFVAWFAWIALWAPRIEVDDEAATIVNVTRTIRVPWEALVHIDTRFALTLITARGRHAVWAAPAPGRTTAYRVSRAERRSAGLAANGADTVRPGDLLATDSGDGAHLVRERWQELLEAGRVRTGVAETTPVVVRWHAVQLAILAGLAVLSVLVLALY